MSHADRTSWQECGNRARLKVWKVQPKGFLQAAFIEVAGTLAGTQGQCKAGLGGSSKGIWGSAPLIVSLANPKEGLSRVNRPGNAARHRGRVEGLDRAAAWVGQVAGTGTLRGDPDFSHPAPLDRWAALGTLAQV